MAKTIAATFDIADQVVKTYDAYEWHNFIADTRENLCPDWDDEVLSLDDLFDTAYGDEFWYELADSMRGDSFPVYAVGFDLCSEEFIWARSERDVEFYNEMALDGDYAEEVFWA